MGDTYGKILDEADLQWLLERARITFSIQNEMSLQELKAPSYRYWTEINGERFLQVVSGSASHYKQEDPEDTLIIKKILRVD